MVRKNAILVLITSVFDMLFNSCVNDHSMNRSCESGLCTNIFVRIMVSIMDADENPVALDSFTVFSVDNGDGLTIELSSQEFGGLRQLEFYLFSCRMVRLLKKNTTRNLYQTRGYKKVE